FRLMAAATPVSDWVLVAVASAIATASVSAVAFMSKSPLPLNVTSLAIDAVFSCLAMMLRASDAATLVPPEDELVPPDCELACELPCDIVLPLVWPPLGAGRLARLE